MLLDTTNQTNRNDNKKKEDKEICILKTRKNSNGLSERERERAREGCAGWLRNLDSETVFRLHIVRLNRYVDEAKKKNE